MSASAARDVSISLGFAFLSFSLAAYCYLRWDKVIEWNGWLRRHAEGTRFERFGFLLGLKSGAWGSGQIARVTTVVLQTAFGLMFVGFAAAILLG